MSMGVSSFFETLRDFSSVGEAWRVSTTEDMAGPWAGGGGGAGEGEVAMAKRGGRVYIRPTNLGILVGDATALAGVFRLVPPHFPVFPHQVCCCVWKGLASCTAPPWAHKHPLVVVVDVGGEMKTSQSWAGVSVLIYLSL